MVKPYIVFSGNCKAALEFNQVAFGSDAPVILPYDDYVPEVAEEAPKKGNA